MGKPCAHLSSSAPGWTWTKGRQGQVQPNRARALGDVGPPPPPPFRLTSNTAAGCALLTIGQHAPGDPLGQAPLVQPSRWPWPWQEGAIRPRGTFPGGPHLRRTGWRRGAERKELLKTSPGPSLLLRFPLLCQQVAGTRACCPLDTCKGPMAAPPIRPQSECRQKL